MRYIAGFSTSTLAIGLFRAAGHQIDWPSYVLGCVVFLIWKLCFSWGEP